MDEKPDPYAASPDDGMAEYEKSGASIRATQHDCTTYNEKGAGLDNEERLDSLSRCGPAAGKQPSPRASTTSTSDPAFDSVSGPDPVPVYLPAIAAAAVAAGGHHGHRHGGGDGAGDGGDDDGDRQDSKQDLGSMLERPLSTTATPLVIPDGGLRAWLTVAGSTAGVTATFGVINSVGTFQSYLASHQLHHFSARDVGWIPAVNIFLCLFLGMQFGQLFDRFGPRGIMLVSSVVFVGGMLGMSFLTCGADDMCSPGTASTRAYALLVLTWGVLCGAAAAATTTTCLAVTAHWFDRRRGVAAGIVYAGSSVGGVTFPLLMRQTLPSLGWGWSVRIVALVVLCLLLVANLCIRGRHAELRRHAHTLKRVQIVDLSSFRDMRFLWASVGIASELIFFCVSPSSF